MTLMEVTVRNTNTVPEQEYQITLHPDTIVSMAPAARDDRLTSVTTVNGANAFIVGTYAENTTAWRLALGELT